eukprot:373551-Rhodomonas_salina.1
MRCATGQGSRIGQGVPEGGGGTLVCVGVVLSVEVDQRQQSVPCTPVCSTKAVYRVRVPSTNQMMCSVQQRAACRCGNASWPSSLRVG